MFHGADGNDLVGIMTPTKIETTDQLVEWVQEKAREIRPTLKPDDDWVPMLFFLKEGETIAAPAPPNAFRDGGTKDRLANAISVMVHVLQPNAVAILVVQWFKELKLTKEERQVLERTPLRQQDSIADDPDRQEKLGLMVYDRNGERLYHAPIKRHSHRAPSLGQWELFPYALGQSRFAEAIVAAFAHNN